MWLCGNLFVTNIVSIFLFIKSVSETTSEDLEYFQPNEQEQY